MVRPGADFVSVGEWPGATTHGRAMPGLSPERDACVWERARCVRERGSAVLDVTSQLSAHVWN